MYSCKTCRLFPAALDNVSEVATRHAERGHTEEHGAAAGAAARAPIEGSRSSDNGRRTEREASRFESGRPIRARNTGSPPQSRSSTPMSVASEPACRRIAGSAVKRSPTRA